MLQPLVKMLVHIVFSTKNRVNLITPEIEPDLFGIEDVRHLWRRMFYDSRFVGLRSFHSLNPTLYCKSPLATRYFFQRSTRHLFLTDACKALLC